MTPKQMENWLTILLFKDCVFFGCLVDNLYVGFLNHFRDIQLQVKNEEL